MIKIKQNKSKISKFKERQKCCLLDSVSQKKDFQIAKCCFPLLPAVILTYPPMHWRFPEGILTDFYIANCRKHCISFFSLRHYILPLLQIKDKILVQVNISDRILNAQGVLKCS